MRRATSFVLCLSMLSSAGCTLFSTNKSGDSTASTPKKPRPERRLDNDLNDEWDYVGHEGRGHRPVEHEWDRWTPYLMSPKARAIEQNLGYGL
jgi:hypothetical protein